MNCANNYVLNTKKLHADSQLPTLGSAHAAGYDLYAYLNDEYSVSPRRITIKPHQTIKVGTGIAAAIPHGYFGAIFARSGLATKQGLRPANCVGVIDEDYRGEICVGLINLSNENFTVHRGDRIAQMLIAPVVKAEIEVVEELSITQRQEGGFCSTGIK